MLKEILSTSIDLYVDQGDTYYKTFTIKDNSGVILNLTGLDISVSMKRYYNTSTEYPLYAEITNAVGGVISLNMLETDTTDLTHGRYVYAVKLSDGTDATKIMSGQVLVSAL